MGRGKGRSPAPRRVDAALANLGRADGGASPDRRRVGLLDGGVGAPSMRNRGGGANSFALNDDADIVPQQMAFAPDAVEERFHYHSGGAITHRGGGEREREREGAAANISNRGGAEDRQNRGGGTTVVATTTATTSDDEVVLRASAEDLAPRPSGGGGGGGGGGGSSLVIASADGGSGGGGGGGGGGGDLASFKDLAPGTAVVTPARRPAAVALADLQGEERVPVEQAAQPPRPPMQPHPSQHPHALKSFEIFARLDRHNRGSVSRADMLVALRNVRREVD